MAYWFRKQWKSRGFQTIFLGVLLLLPISVAYSLLWVPARWELS